MARKDTHNGSRYATESKRFKTMCIERNAPCALCGRPIDYSLKHTDRMAFTVDHIVPTSLGGDPYDLANMQPAHRFCNSSRGNRPVKTKQEQTHARLSISTSRDWLGEGGIPLGAGSGCPGRDSTDSHTQ